MNNDAFAADEKRNGEDSFYGHGLSQPECMRLICLAVAFAAFLFFGNKKKKPTFAASPQAAPRRLHAFRGATAQSRRADLHLKKQK